MEGGCHDLFLKNCPGIYLERLTKTLRTAANLLIFVMCASQTEAYNIIAILSENI